MKSLFISLSLLLPTALYSDSLTISPIGLSIHGYDVSGLNNVPRSLGTKQVTWHPELMVTYKTENWQYTGFYFRDTIDNDSGGAFAGPKMNLGNYFSLGAVGGFLVRNPQNGVNIVSLSLTEDVQVLPLVGATASLEVPVNSKLGIEVNAFSNYLITHATLGFKVKF